MQSIEFQSNHIVICLVSFQKINSDCSLICVFVAHEQIKAKPIAIISWELIYCGESADFWLCVLQKSDFVWILWFLIEKSSQLHVKLNRELKKERVDDIYLKFSHILFMFVLLPDDKMWINFVEFRLVSHKINKSTLVFRLIFIFTSCHRSIHNIYLIQLLSRKTPKIRCLNCVI